MSDIEHRPAIAPAIERRPAGVVAAGRAIPLDWVERYGVPPTDADEQRAWLVSAIGAEERRIGGPVVVRHVEPTTERRFAPLAATVGSGGGAGDVSRVSGVAVPFGNLSSNLGGFRERFSREAFREQFPSFRGVFSTLQHDAQVVLGTTRARTLRLKLAARALRFELDLPASEYVRSLVSRGDLHGASIGFRAKEDVWSIEGGEPIRTVESAKLIEVALVHLPAYGDALLDVSPAKRQQARPLEAQRRMLDLRRHRGPDGRPLPRV